jgi:hypothetical protein
MATITTNIHLSPGDEIDIERVDGHQWLRLSMRCSVFASDADLARIRDEIDRHLTMVRDRAEAA